MKSIKIYLDTSVISMRDNPELGAVTWEFFEFVTQKNCELVISEVAKMEIERISDESKKLEIFQFLETLNCVLLPYLGEAHLLAEIYVKDRVLTNNHLDDLTHVAYATVHKCDMIVSWNRKHIAKPIKIQKLNLCNVKYNYSTIAICTPEEFLTIYK
ncbi:MAG: hypothetical protein LBC02_01235 [Planctomycetaceae bacterium]|jgi:predicted nucleic acid-binding protein|nr:hypothetical protein [Planctomycetaceae bacterium]